MFVSRGLACVLALSLVVRAMLLFQLADSPTFEAPEGGDSRFFDSVARGAETGRAYFHSPLYQWWLTAFYTLFGRELALLRAAQLALGVASAGLVHQLTYRLFRRENAACLAGCLFAVSGWASFYSGHLLVDALTPLLTLTTTLAGLAAVNRPSLRRSALAGALLAVFALARPTALVLVPLLLFGLRRSPRQAAAATVALLLTLAPATAINLQRETDPVLLTANGGLNFYIGTLDEGRGSYALPSELWFRPGDPSDDFSGRIAAERAAGRQLSSAEVSSWWLRRGWARVVEAPTDYARLALNKLALLVHHREPSQLYSYEGYAAVCPILSWLAPAAVVVALGLPGLFRALRSRASRRSVRGAACAALALGLVLLPFFVVGRFRLPLLTLLCPFAGFTLAQLLTVRVAERWRHALAVLVSLAVTAIPATSLATSVTAQYLHFARAEKQRGNTPAARRWYLAALAHQPCSEAAASESLALQRRQDPAAALETAKAHLERCGKAPRVLTELGLCELRAGDASGAEVTLREALELAPASLQAWRGLALSLERQQRTEEAHRARETARRIAQTRRRSLLKL